MREPGQSNSGSDLPAAGGLAEVLALVELALLAAVEGRDRAVVAHDPGPDLAGLALGVVESGDAGKVFGTGFVDQFDSPR